MDRTALWPFAAYFFIVVVLAAGILVLSWLLGQRHSDPQTGEPYESGVLPVGSARLRFDARFYLIAMFFVVFDLEAAFVFAWAVALHDAGWTGYIDMLVFIGILLAALAYLWRLGALEWESMLRGRARLNQKSGSRHERR